MFRRRTPRDRRSQRLGIESLEQRTMFATMAIGMNLDHVAEYNEAWMFTDAFLNSRSWISHAYNTATRTMSWDGGGPVRVDSRGWPTALGTFTNAQGQVIEQRLGAQMFVGLNGHYPAGTYRAQWRGNATLSWGGDAVATRTGTNADGTRFAEVNVTPTNRGIYVRVDSLGGAPLTDLRIWLPDHGGRSFVGQVWRPGESFSPYHPLFLDTLRPFGSVRVMQPQSTVTSDIVTWSDRRSVDYFRQSMIAGDFSNGMAPELLVRLANDLGRDLWICMPHTAGEDYVRNMARLVRDSLSPNLKVFVEWSNEPWNPAPGFETNAWLREQASLPANAGLTIYDIWARNAREDFRIWREEFTGQSQRLVRVVAGQAANSWVMDQLLQRMEGEFDSISCDGYVTFARPQLTQFSASTTADQVIDAMLAESLPHTLQFLANHKALADRYSAQLGRRIRFDLYEGGPLLQNYQRQPYEAAFAAASQSPRLYDVYRGLLRGAEAIDVDSLQAFVLFDGSPFGDNSHLAYQDQAPASSPKYRALLEAISGTIYESTPITPPATPPTTSVVTLPLVNPGFESGSLNGWTLTPSFGNFTTVASAFRDPLAPARPHDGRFAVWAAGVDGRRGGGATTAGVAQRLSLATMAQAIDAGTARLTFTGWGAGGGAVGQSARLEIRFFNAAGVSLGSTVTSNAATASGTWTRMTAEAAVPVGARGVELRAVTMRPARAFANRAGFDDLAATLSHPTMVSSTDRLAAFAAMGASSDQSATANSSRRQAVRRG